MFGKMLLVVSMLFIPIQLFAGQKTAKIFSEIVIVDGADFQNFSDYMNETKEEYRKRRILELPVGVNSYDGSYDVSVTETYQALSMMVALEYDKNKKLYQSKISMDLAGQIRSELYELKKNNLMLGSSDAFSLVHNNNETLNLKKTLNDLNKGNVDVTRVANVFSDNIANYFIYGFWSYANDPVTMERNIRITVNIDSSTGEAVTLSAYGDQNYGAAHNIAAKIFEYFAAKKEVNRARNPQPDLKFLAPYSIEDKKTVDEARNYCRAQSSKSYSYRLPYASEVRLIPDKYKDGGAIFIDSAKYDYAIEDRRGTYSNMKYVKSGVRVVPALDNEALNYFCVSEQNVKQDQMEDMFESLYNRFYNLKKARPITKENCRDRSDRLNVREIKDLAVQIRNLDKTAMIKAVVKKCVTEYLENRPELFSELTLMRN